MALATSVNEANWVITRRGQDTENIQSASFTQVINVISTVTSVEYKYYGLTVLAGNQYLVDHVDLNLEIEFIPNMPTACNLIKRLEVRQITEVQNLPLPTPPA